MDLVSGPRSSPSRVSQDAYNGADSNCQWASNERRNRSTWNHKLHALDSVIQPPEFTLWGPAQKAERGCRDKYFHSNSSSRTDWYYLLPQQKQMRGSCQRTKRETWIEGKALPRADVSRRQTSSAVSLAERWVRHHRGDRKSIHILYRSWLSISTCRLHSGWGLTVSDTFFRRLQFIRCAFAEAEGM